MRRTKFELLRLAAFDKSLKLRCEATKIYIEVQDECEYVVQYVSVVQGESSGMTTMNERERERKTRNINSLIGTPPFDSEEVFGGFSKQGVVVLLLLLLNAEEMLWIGLDMLFPIPRIRSLFRSAIRGIEIA